MPVCKSGIDQKNNKQSGKLKVSLSAPSSKGKPTLRNRLTEHAADAWIEDRGRKTGKTISSRLICRIFCSALPCWKNLTHPSAGKRWAILLGEKLAGTNPAAAPAKSLYPTC